MPSHALYCIKFREFLTQKLQGPVLHICLWKCGTRPAPRQILTNQQWAFVGVSATSWDPTGAGISANPGCNINHCAPENQPWHHLWPQPLTWTLKQGNCDVITRFLAFDLDFWPMTLTYNPNLTMVKVTLHTKYKKRMDRRFHVHYLARFTVVNNHISNV